MRRVEASRVSFTLFSAQRFRMGWVQAGIELGEEFLNLPIFSGHALHLFLGPFMPFQIPDSSLSIPLVVLYALTVFSLVLFICLYLRERRSVFVGWLLIATVGLLGTSLGVTAIVAENQILLVLAFLIVIVPAILSIFTPLGLTGLFLYSGVRLIVREGFRSLILWHWLPVLPLLWARSLLPVRRRTLRWAACGEQFISIFRWC